MNEINNACPRTAMGRLILILLLCAVVLAPIQGLSAGKLQEPVVKVNDAVLTEADLEEALNAIMPAGVFHGGFSSKKRAKHRPKALEKMIEMELFYQEAKNRGLKIEKGVLEKERKKTVERTGGEKKFKAALKRAGLTDKQYMEKLGKMHLVRRITTIEIKEKAEVSDEEVEEHYNENREKFKMPETRKITHILVAVKPEASKEDKKIKMERAREVIDKINAGEEMSALAWNYSDGPYRVKGGDLGFVHQGRLEKELEKEAFALEVGRLSGVIETRYGYHIVRVEDVMPPAQLSLEEAAEGIEKKLTGENEKRLHEQFIGLLRAMAIIEVY